MFLRILLLEILIALANGSNDTETDGKIDQNGTVTTIGSKDGSYTSGMWSLVIVMIGIVFSFIGFCIALCLFMKLENPDSNPSHQKPVKLMTGSDEEEIDEKSRSSKNNVV